MSLCLDHISDRIDGLEVKLRTVDGNPLVMVRIPSSNRIPHMVTLQHRTDFYTRYEDGKREREAFNQDLVARRLSSIKTQLQNMIGTQRAQRQPEETEREIQQGVVPRFLGIEDGAALADKTSRRFTDETGTQPFFRIAVTPTRPKVDLIDVDSEPLRTIIQNPSGSNLVTGFQLTMAYTRFIVHSSDNPFMKISKKCVFVAVS